MNIIGLVGFIGSGKDTVAKILTQNGCVQDSFASPLKELCASVFGWPREMLQGNYLDNLTRDGFRIAHETSSYSFAAVGKAAIPLLSSNSALFVYKFCVLRKHQ